MPEVPTRLAHQGAGMLVQVILASCHFLPAGRLCARTRFVKTKASSNQVRMNQLAHRELVCKLSARHTCSGCSCNWKPSPDSCSLTKLATCLSVLASSWPIAIDSMSHLFTTNLIRSDSNRSRPTHENQTLYIRSRKHSSLNLNRFPNED